MVTFDANCYGEPEFVIKTPAYLKWEGQPVGQPEFHHLFKHVRDRLNALSAFYGPGPIHAGFKGLRLAAEYVASS
jgi:uncharacterized ferritin-like protein (DUF455 family)